VMVDLFADQARRSRWRKIAAMAATRHNPALLAQIASVQAEFTSRVAELYTLASDRGWVQVHVNPSALAYAMQGLALAPVFAEISPDAGVTAEDFTEIFMLFHQVVTS